MIDWAVRDWLGMKSQKLVIYIPVLHICSNKLLAFSPMIRTSRFIYAFTFSHNLVKATYFFLIFSLFSSYFEPGGCSYCSSVLPDCRPTRACQYRQISEKEISFTEASVICVTTLKMLWIFQEMMELRNAAAGTQFRRRVYVLRPHVLPEDVCEEVTLQAVTASPLTAEVNSQD